MLPCLHFETISSLLLSKLAEFFQKKDMGLYRDDGLAVLKDAPGHDADAARKRIMAIFQRYGLKITIQANLKTTNFLDASFNLGTRRYRPYRKPNDEPIYLHTMSNHPPRILENLPKAIGRRVSDLSCDHQIFTEAAHMYERALSASGFDAKLICNVIHTR